MRTRHKPPALVSMWMLDVFCCALGCVTLLWLLNIREAKLESTRAQTALSELKKTEETLTQVRGQLATAVSDIQTLNRQLAAAEATKQSLATQLALSKAEVVETNAKLANAVSLSQEQAELLAKRLKETAELQTKLQSTTTAAEDLAKLLRDKERERTDLQAKQTKLEEQLNDADAKLRVAKSESVNSAKEMAALKKSNADMAESRAAIKDLQAKLDDANAHIIDLQGDKKKLADKVNILRTESESRFAGIAMTGKRVVMLVDISGSMKLLDEKNAAPGKWATVVETVAKVMRSIPELEQFQIITFSRRADYLLGNGEWQSFKGEESIRKVTEALAAVNPVGDTNLYSAFDLAFRLKPLGMDTIYLFSDGLPTSGPGLSAEQEKLPDGAKTDLLARHIRRNLEVNWNPGGRNRVKINSIGFFYESPEVGAFLWSLSRENEGSFVGMSKP